MEGIILLAAAGIAVVIYLAVHRTPSDYNIDAVTIGDSMDQVRSLFGGPKNVTKPGYDGGEDWEYTIPFRLYVSIGFGKDGRVASKYRSGEV